MPERSIFAHAFLFSLPINGQKYFLVPEPSIQLLSAAIAAGDARALARGITLVENALAGSNELLASLTQTGAARVVGITGPPGAGKSTIVNALLEHWVNAGKKIAVIAVDPSSPFHYGALLGDRIRMSKFYNNDQVFIRSLASRGALGGLNPRILEITDLVKSAPYDIVLVETVGVGQSEVEIAGLADCTVVALVPEAGDIIQTLKAGLMEIADLFVVNKADREAAETLYQSLRMMVHERAGHDAETPVLKTVALTGEGIAALADAIENQLQYAGQLTAKRSYLLTQKCLQIIRQRRMENIDTVALKAALEKALAMPDFNLYQFAEAYDIAFDAREKITAETRRRGEQNT